MLITGKVVNHAPKSHLPCSPAMLLSLGVVFLAELGDRSQLIIMTSTLHYRWWPRLWRKPFGGVRGLRPPCYSSGYRARPQRCLTIRAIFPATSDSYSRSSLREHRTASQPT